jgi:hypothetical protein
VPPAAQPSTPGRAAVATPPAPPGDPTHGHPRGPINADGGFCWQNGRDTEEGREAWARGARGAASQRCPLCTAPLVWNRSIGGELVCWGCLHSTLPLHWRRRVVQLWLTGIRASIIAERIGGTKSAVLAYRRRARLPARGSPLIGCDDSQANKAKRRRRAIENAPHVRKLPAAPKPRPAPRVAKVRTSAVPGRAASATESAGRPKGPGALPPHASRHGFKTCQYILGKSQFCDDATAELSPYCPAHTQLCFVARKAA